jgi:hypothetical protein
MSPSDHSCRQAHLMRIETFDDILTDNRVVTWDTTRAKELVARRSVMEVEMDREQRARIMEQDHRLPRQSRIPRGSPQVA